MTPRRLEAEAIRDGMLAISGRLDRLMGGLGYYMFEPSTNYVTLYKPKKVLEPGDYRRMVYMLKVRSQQDGTFGLFDCPDASTARPKRTTSTTVLQALNLLNGSFVTEQSAAFAERLRHDDLAVHPDQALEVKAQVQFLIGELPPAPALKVLPQRGALVQRQRVEPRDFHAAAGLGVERVELPNQPDLMFRAEGALEQPQVLHVHAHGAPLAWGAEARGAGRERLQHDL